MHRGADGVQNKELDALWHGEVDMTVTDEKQQTVTVDLVKDTNKFRIVVQGASEIGLKQEYVDFTITDDNGCWHMTIHCFQMNKLPISLTSKLMRIWAKVKEEWMRLWPN